jgi:hypothetical protein
VTAPVVRPIDQAASSPAEKPTALPPDAMTALSVLESLNQAGEPITYDRWREAVMVALPEGKRGKPRNDAAKRQALSAARKLLMESGAVSQNGETVSVSIPSG